MYDLGSNRQWFCHIYNSHAWSIFELVQNFTSNLLVESTCKRLDGVENDLKNYKVAGCYRSQGQDC